MKEKLREIVAKAAAAPGSYGDLGLLYQRGHELSGMTRFEMGEGGAFKLAADRPRRQFKMSREGNLTAAQRMSILSAMDEAKLLDVPSSTRNIGDDEVPVIFEVSYDDLRHRILIWAKDAVNIADLQRFEAALWSVLRELSDGEVGARPAG